MTDANTLRDWFNEIEALTKGYIRLSTMDDFVTLLRALDGWAETNTTAEEMPH